MQSSILQDEGPLRGQDSCSCRHGACALQRVASCVSKYGALTAVLQAAVCSLQCRHYQVKRETASQFFRCPTNFWSLKMHMHTLNRFDTNISPVDQGKEWAWWRDILSPWMSFILHWHRHGPTAALQGLDLVQMKAILDGAQVPRIVKLHLCARLSLRLALQLQAEVAKNCMTSTNLSGLRVCSQTPVVQHASVTGTCLSFLSLQTFRHQPSSESMNRLTSFFFPC